MKKEINELIVCALIGIALGILGILGIVQYQTNLDLKSKINNVGSQLTISERINDYTIQGIEKDIEDNYSDLNKKIEQVPEVEKVKKLALEAKLKQINVFVVNETINATGSGVTIKYKDKFYVLSAGHMATTPEDKLSLSENGETICELEIVKQDYSEELTKDGNDLLLLRPKDPNIIPRIYVEIADIEPETSNELYIVGNPMGVEDVVSDARVIMYQGNFMYMIATSSYFGNSGGGIYTREGKLVGIMSHLIPVQPSPTVPAWMIHGCVRLSVILEFLRGVS